jgi:UDP-N-acetylmuramate dehydrogenase
VGGAIAGNAGAYGTDMGSVIRTVTVVMPDGARVTLRASELAFAYRAAHLPEGAIVLAAEVALARADRSDVAHRTREALNAKKAAQPVDERSAGCVFKNPAGEAAGALIDRAGCKGMRRGEIEVSVKHANFFINRGVGTAGDFLALMERVAGRVRDVFGIELEPEIRVVGG